MAVSPTTGAADRADAAIDTFQTGGYADVNGDGTDDAVVAMDYAFASGGNAATPNVAVGEIGPNGPRQLGPAIDGFGPRLEGSTIVVKRAQYLRADPVGAGNWVVAGQAAFRYSWMSPSHRVLLLLAQPPPDVRGRQDAGG